MDKQTKEALKQMQTEMRQLHALIADGRSVEGRKADSPPAEEPAPPTGKSKSDTVVQYSIQRPASGEADLAFKTGSVAVSAAQIAKATDEGASRCQMSARQPKLLCHSQQTMKGETAWHPQRHVGML